MTETTATCPSVPRGRWADLLSRDLLPKTLLVSFGIGLHAFNEIAIAPVLPVAVLDLHGVRFLPWAWSLFYAGVVTGGVTATLLRQRFGARRALVAAGLLHLAGMVLGVTATVMAALIAGRLAQGLAAGWIVALCYGLIPSLFPARLIARVFSLEAAVWAVAALLGPMAGGLATELSGWRAGLAVAFPLLITFLAVALMVAPRGAGEKIGDGQVALPGRVSPALCLAAVLILSLPSALPAEPAAALAIPAGILVCVLAFRFDARQKVRFLPPGLFGFRTVTGRGSWVLFLMSAAHSTTTVFLALLLKPAFGLSPVWTGLVVVTMALSWSAVAIPAGNAESEAARRRLLHAGPLFEVAGMLLIAGGFAFHALPLIVLGQAAVGTAFALVWGLLNEAIVRDAAPEVRARVSAVLPTLATCGSIVGAGSAGWLAAVSGVSGGDAAAIAARAPWLWLFGALSAGLAFAAVRGIRLAHTEG